MKSYPNIIFISLMFKRTVILTGVISLGFLSSCISLSPANQDSPERSLVEKASDEDARLAAEQILNETCFLQGSDNPKLVYAIEGQYIYELRDAQITAIPRPLPANLTERANKIGWFGSINISANSSKRIDRLNCVSTKYEEGTKLIPDDILILTKEGNNWRCDECKTYQKPPGKNQQKQIAWVKDWLKRCDK